MRDIATTKRVAITATNPLDHCSIQLKGASVEAASRARRKRRSSARGATPSRTARHDRHPAPCDAQRRPTGRRSPSPRGSTRFSIRRPGPERRHAPAMNAPSAWRICSAASRASCPSIIATSDARGMPNVTYLSQVYLRRRRARRAVAAVLQQDEAATSTRTRTPASRSCDPLTMQAYRLRLKFLRSETSGPLFDSMKLRIDAIASHTGMDGVFRLISADVFEVLSIEKSRAFSPTAPADDRRDASLDGLAPRCAACNGLGADQPRRPISSRCSPSCSQALDEYFGFEHSMLLLLDEPRARLVDDRQPRLRRERRRRRGRARRRPDRHRRARAPLLRVTGLEADLRYGRAVRRETAHRAAGARARRRDPAARPLPTHRACWRCRSPSATGWSACIAAEEPRSAALRRMARGLPRDHREPDRARRSTG